MEQQEQLTQVEAEEVLQLVEELKEQEQQGVQVSL
jgi:hypothetical protein